MCVFSILRKRRGPLKHIKFGTNIDVSDERKWVWRSVLASWSRAEAHAVLFPPCPPGGSSSCRSWVNCQPSLGWSLLETCSAMWATPFWAWTRSSCTWKSPAAEFQVITQHKANKSSLYLVFYPWKCLNTHKQWKKREVLSDKERMKVHLQ